MNIEFQPLENTIDFTFNAIRGKVSVVSLTEKEFLLFCCEMVEDYPFIIEQFLKTQNPELFLFRKIRSVILEYFAGCFLDEKIKSLELTDKNKNWIANKGDLAAITVLAKSTFNKYKTIRS
jgi:hypothetical protein